MSSEYTKKNLDISNVELENYDYNYSAWLNDGSSFSRISNFTEPSTGELQAGTAEIGDFDNDGKNEILVARYGGNDQNGVTNFSVAAYELNNSTNNYEIVYNPGPINGFANNDWGCPEMKIKDINNDGVNDMIFFLEKSDGNAIEIWKGSSNGEFNFDINIDLTGKDIVVIGRSNIVGRPMSILVSSNNANGTCTVCHSKTKNINDYSRNADIIISAIGVPNFLTPEMIKEDSIIIDVGINRIDSDNEKGYKIVGDADYDSVFDKVSKITPVPGGVGPMTIAMLVENTIEAAENIQL